MAKATFTEKEMAHELKTRAEAKGINISIEHTGEILNMFENIVTERLEAGEEVKMRNFGTFEVRMQKARTRYNPATKQNEDYPEKKVPKWDASDNVRNRIANS